MKSCGVEGPREVPPAARYNSRQGASLSRLIQQKSGTYGCFGIWDGGIDLSAKRRVGLLFGGRSGEHEVSVRSAASICEVVDRSRYEFVLIGVDKTGRWWHTCGDSPQHPSVEAGLGTEVVAAPGATGCRLLDSTRGSQVVEIDVVFPILHGPHGEDGTVQGLCEVLDVPCVGAGVLGSAIGMDKDVHKRLLRDAGLPIVPFEVVRAHEWSRGADNPHLADRLRSLGVPLFVKPANLGSSVGISKVGTLSEIDAAFEEAFRYDRKAVVEKGLDAREIECAVLGNDDPRVSVAGEIAPGEDFYSYEDKYSADSAAKLLIPAPLPEALSDEIRQLAVKAYSILELRGMARVDFFVDRKTSEIYLNEPNTLPGFTSISQYPKLWEASGLPFRDLVSELIELAVTWAQDSPKG